MKSLSILLAVTLAIATPTAALALRPGGGGGGGGRPSGGGGGGGRAPAAARPSGGRTTAPTQSMRGSQPTKGTGSNGRGFNMGNDVPSTRPAGGNANRGTANNGNRTNANNGNRTNANNGNKNNGNKNNTNKNNNNTNKNNNNTNNRVNNAHNNGNTYNMNRTVNANGGGYNNYGYRGAVVVNPGYGGAAWGWNHGAVWAPAAGYWGGGFWGSFAAGAATAAVMGSIVNANQTYTSYQVAPSSPGSTLLSDYGLQQTQCGSGNLVVIYGPNNGVICAYPNDKVAAGNYAVNADTLTLQSQ